MLKKVEKPWGREIWFAHEKEYAGKLLEITAGRRLSHQFHRVKKETIYVLKGELEVLFGGEELVLREKDVLTIHPGVKHRFAALSDVILVEVSTPELDDVVRIEDDFGRK
jgi:quercetin dioxygenase-like cupin family protein